MHAHSNKQLTANNCRFGIFNKPWQYLVKC